MPRPLRVLVVEDYPAGRELLQQLLEEWSCVVETASNGAEGLSLALERNYDIVILDLNLPKVDGLEVGRTISQRSPRPYLCAFTSYGNERDRERTRIAGFDRHITKGSTTELEGLISQLKVRL